MFVFFFFFLIIILWFSYFLVQTPKFFFFFFLMESDSKSTLLVTIFFKKIWEILRWSWTRSSVANIKHSRYFSMIGSIIDTWSPLMQSISEGPWCISMGHNPQVWRMLSPYYPYGTICHLKVKVTPFIRLFHIIARLETRPFVFIFTFGYIM